MGEKPMRACPCWLAAGMLAVFLRFLSASGYVLPSRSHIWISQHSCAGCKVAKPSSRARDGYLMCAETCPGLQILRKPDGGSRGFGFVTYKDEMSVEKCLVMQHSLNGRTVELKRAIKKEDMAPGSSGNTYGGSSGGGSGGPVRGAKQPDWTCPDCKNKNFGWREICNRCGVGFQVEHPDMTQRVVGFEACGLHRSSNHGDAHAHSHDRKELMPFQLVCNVHVHTNCTLSCHVPQAMVRHVLQPKNVPEIFLAHEVARSPAVHGLQRCLAWVLQCASDPCVHFPLLIGMATQSIIGSAKATQRTCCCMLLHFRVLFPSRPRSVIPQAVLAACWLSMKCISLDP